MDGADANGSALYVRLKKVTYPSGRQIHYVYEAPPTSRLSSVSENSGGTQNLVAYTYLGMSTIVKESHPQVSGGLNLSYGSAGTYAGWTRFGQIVQQLWKNDASTTVDGYTYTYDRAGNRTAKTNTLNSAFSETYSYDDLNRLVDANRNGTNLQDWTLDALGNWSGFTDGATSQTRTHDAANQTTDISGSWIDPTYDAAGNMISGPKAGDETTRLHFVYDAWNRLVAVKADNSGQPGSTIATYAYDGMGRRVSKTVGSDTFDFYYNEQYQVLEVRKNGDTDPYEQYVYDQRYVDAPVMVYRDTNTDGLGIQSVYVTQDANFNVTGIIDGSNDTVLNRFVYMPYGAWTVLNASWAAGTTDFMLGHQGLMLDTESGLYYNRARYYHPTVGTFTARDPLGYVDGENLFIALGDNPLRHSDPSGTVCRVFVQQGSAFFGVHKRICIGDPTVPASVMCWTFGINGSNFWGVWLPGVDGKVYPEPFVPGDPIMSGCNYPLTDKQCSIAKMAMITQQGKHFTWRLGLPRQNTCHNYSYRTCNAIADWAINGEVQ